LKILQDVSLNVVILIFRAYLSEQTIEQLAASLRKGGIKDVASFFPANKRDSKSVEDFFRSQGLPQVSDLYVKRQHASTKESILSTIREMRGNDESTEEVSCCSVRCKVLDSFEQISAFVKQGQLDTPLPEVDLVQTLWQGFVLSVDWNAARPDQIEGLSVKELTVSLTDWNV
jgi:hypothetical protein